MTQPISDTKQFGKIRSFFWPVHSYELKKLIPMLLLFFFMSFIYSVLRNMKDALIVTAEASGAETIPFIKMYALFPSAILLTALFGKLSSHFSREHVFYIMVTIFILFFVIFGFVLYPLRDILHPHKMAIILSEHLPQGFMGLIAMLRYWTFTAFYVMSELWGAILFSLLFWGFANDITRVCEAKRFYGLFAIGSNFASIASGQVSLFLSRREYNPLIPFGSERWEQSLMLLIVVVFTTGILLVTVFRWMHNHVLIDPRLCNVDAVKETLEKKTAMSLRKNLTYLLRSNYLLSVAAIVVSYNVVINLVEVVWKHQIKLLHPHPADYSAYMNEVTTITGIVAALIALFISGNSIRQRGWTFTALITPVTLLITSIAFFGILLFKGHLQGVLVTLTGMTPLYLITVIGSTQNIMSRAVKYTVFDATKEIAFIPLDRDARLKGKAAIDGVCSRMGKSGGSLIHQALLMIFGSLSLTAPYVGAILMVIIVTWIVATKNVGKKIDILAKEHELDIIAKAKASAVKRTIAEADAQSV